MANKSRSENSFIRDTVLFPLYLCVLSVVSLVVSMAQGTSAMFYAGLPLWLTASYLMMSIGGGTAEVRRQIQQRIKRRHFNDAMQVVKGALLGALAMGLVMTLLYTLGAQFIATYILGMRDAYLVLYTLAPAVFLGSFLGVARGILEAVGFNQVSVISLMVLMVLSLICPIIGAMQMAGRGEQVGALLMNAGYKAVYVAAGAGIGISVAVTITFIVLVITSSFAIKYIHDHQDYLGIDNEETARDLFVYYFFRVGPYALVGFVPVLLVTIDYRIYTMSLSATAADYHSEWGGFMGITFPIVLFLVCVFGAWFTQDVQRLTAEYVKEAYKRLRIHWSMVMRLSGYLLIPAMFYVFGAAKPFVEIFHGSLYGKATDGAVLSLKYMSPLIFLGATMLIVGCFYWEAYYRNVVVVSFLFGAAFEVGAMSILIGAGWGMNAVPIALDVFGVAFLGVAFYLGGRHILSRCESSWLIDDLMVLFSSAIAAVPVILLNDIMTTGVYPLIGVLVLLVIFVPCYVVLTIYLGCVDYGNIGRLPGGRYIVQLGVMLGRYSEEE